jgi:hypothetical protein
MSTQSGWRAVRHVRNPSAPNGLFVHGFSASLCPYPPPMYFVTVASKGLSNSQSALEPMLTDGLCKYCV